MRRSVLALSTPALLIASLAVGSLALTGAARADEPAPQATASAEARAASTDAALASLAATTPGTITGPLGAVTAQALAAKDDARAALGEAMGLSAVIAISPVSVPASAEVSLDRLRDLISQLEGHQVRVAATLPAVTDATVAETAAVREDITRLAAAFEKAQDERTSAIAAKSAADAVAAAKAEVARIAAEAEAQRLAEEAAAAAAAEAEAARQSAIPNVNINVDPASAQGIARGMVAGYGWGDDQFACLVALWNRESGWNAAAYNASSGAYGIPQALPGDKMASAGADWQTNPATQIAWGLGYISGRYGTPCGAWDHSESVGWY